MPVPILTPENSITVTCPDSSCAYIFAARLPQPEVINARLPLIVYHAEDFDCPACHATYRWVVMQAQTAYNFVRLDGLPSGLIKGN